MYAISLEYQSKNPVTTASTAAPALPEQREGLLAAVCRRPVPRAATELTETSEVPQTVIIREGRDACWAFRQGSGQQVKQALSVQA